MEQSVIPAFLTGFTKATDEIGKTVIEEFNKMDIVDFLLSSEMIASYVFIVVSLIVYLIVRKRIRSQEIDQFEKLDGKDEEQPEINKLKVKRIFLRNGFVFFLAIGLFFIWKDEIKTTFFSISFAIMAIVVLFKEILFNIISSFVLSFSKPFNIGDMIEVKGKIGTVSDRTMFNTKIIIKKDGINSGQEFVLPNSYFMTNEFVSLSKLGNYSTHFFNIHLKREELLIGAKLLKQIAEDVTLNSKGRGEKLHNWRKNLKKKESMDIPSHKPFVFIHPEDKPYLTLKYTCDNRTAFLLKNEILEKFLEKLPEELTKEKEEKPDMPVLDTIPEDEE